MSGSIVAPISPGRPYAPERLYRQGPTARKLTLTVENRTRETGVHGDCQTAAMLTVGSVVIGVEDIHRAVAFWTEALGYRAKRELGPDDDFTILEPISGTGTHLALDVSESPVQRYPRIHLDLYAGDAAEQAAEIERLVALGATRIDWDRYPSDPDFVVLADTEGNPFCVIDTSH